MLNKAQKKCLELMLTGNLTQKEIAAQIKKTEQTICNWKKDEEFMGEYNRLMRLSIQTLAAKAYQTQVKLLDAESENVRFMTAKDILDRAGYKSAEKLEFNGNVTNSYDELTADELRVLAKACETAGDTAVE